MYNTFWIGIIIGGVLSLAASICANLLHNRILGILDNRKLAAQSKRFSKASEFHTLVEQLHTGARDKNIYMMRLCVTIIGSFIASFVAVSVGLITATFAPNFSTETITGHSVVAQLVMFFAFVLMGSLYIKSSARFRAVMNALDDFDRFDAAFKENWKAHLTTP